MFPSWWGEPRIEYSHDGGKTWRTDGPNIGPNAWLRVITATNEVLFTARAVEKQRTCTNCKGSGTETCYIYERTDKGGAS